MIKMTHFCEYCGEELIDGEYHMCEGLAAGIAKYVRGELKTNTACNDPVNRPKHYTSHPSGVECIDITKHYNFQIGNAMKYLWRQGLKDEVGLDSVEKQIQDCEKAVWYIQSFIDDLKKEV